MSVISKKLGGLTSASEGSQDLRISKKLSEEEKEINLLRKQVGLKPTKVKERECLCCSSKFVSYGNCNRLCMKCNASNKELGE